MDGQAKLFSFGFSRGRSGNQPKPNPSSFGSSEQIQKPSFSKELTSSPLEEEQCSRSQSVTAPSFIPGFNIGCIGARRFLCTMRSVSQKSWSRCWAVDHEANDQLELIYVSCCVEGRNCMMLKRWLDMAERTDRASYLKLLTKIGQNCSIRHNLQKNFRGGGQAPDPHLPKSNCSQYPLSYAPARSERKIKPA